MGLSEDVLKVRVGSKYACFTRPDLKVERMSYPCMTFSAARGVLDSILWKPEFKWWIRCIKVLNEIKFISIKRNELKSKCSGKPIIIEDDRTQRNSLILYDVSYLIEASIYQDSFDAANPPKKYEEMFKHRVSKGQCYRRPYLGTREFSCDFFDDSNEQPIDETIPIGSMFYDMYYTFDGKAEPCYIYDAAIRNGVLKGDEALNNRLMQSSHIRPERSSAVRQLLTGAGGTNA
jgi:CRISPR-associated protein Cas5d